MNSLLKQIKEGRIVAIHRCHNCGGKLKASQDTALESLDHCEHCDSGIQTVDLADFLRTANS